MSLIRSKRSDKFEQKYLSVAELATRWSVSPSAIYSENAARVRSLPFALENQFGFSEQRSRPSREIGKRAPARPKPLYTTTALPVPT